MAGDRRYNEREVELILERVAELHERDGENAGARAMTRKDIEHIVDELGMSKALVARATSELATQDVRNRPLWWLGGKTDLLFEEVVDGHLDDAALTPMLEVLRRTLGDPGELKHEAGARIWSTSTVSQQVHFTVVEHAGRTTLRLEERMAGEAGAIAVASAALGGLLGFFMMVPLKALVTKAVLLLLMGPLVLSGAIAGWLGARAIWRRRSTKREQQLRRAFAAIVTSAADGKALPAAPHPDESDDEPDQP
ncbi:MAG TPA: hypothetical protein VK034_07990 [Enhygromyxa sp.]|nr:hypothetical protein [Enhygromyxa sp.]